MTKINVINGGARPHLARPEGGQGAGRAAPPKLVLEGVDKAAADKAKEALEGVSATVSVSVSL